jgi:hypothetical protein
MHWPSTAPDYREFLESKQSRVSAQGFDVAPISVNARLFPFQRDIVRWTVRKGRAAVFADTGLGKTYMQLEWARLISRSCGAQGVSPFREPPVLILAPLGVVEQTVRMGRVLGVAVNHCKTQADVGAGVNITNYERLYHFSPDGFCAIVLDESSILKAFDGALRKDITQFGSKIDYRLACTATPAPNDIAEIANHAEFLGIMSRTDMLATYFVHDDNGWRLKGHATDPFYKWLASWAMSMRRPSDLGYSDDGYELPPLHIEPVFVDVDYVPEGKLFFTDLKGIEDRARVRHATITDRVAAAAALVNQSTEPWIIWHGLNDEGDALLKAVPDGVLVEGSQSPEKKAAALEDFQVGEHRVLITKPKIAGFGLNFQTCHNMVFVGLSDSWEAYYQCIRRCYRFGQSKPVNVHIVLSEPERGIFENIMRKEREAISMSEQLVAKERERASMPLTSPTSVSTPSCWVTASSG